MSAPYVILDRPGLVHQVCPCCGGDGQRDYWIGESCRVGLCGYCAGRGYIVTEAPKPTVVHQPESHE